MFVYNNQIIINWNDNSNNKLSIYDPENDNITDMATSLDNSYINYNNVIIGRNIYANSLRNIIKLYKYENNILNYAKEYKICDDNNSTILLFNYNDKIVCMSYEYYYPFGLIYDENRNTSPNLQITQFDMSKILDE